MTLRVISENKNALSATLQSECIRVRGLYQVYIFYFDIEYLFLNRASRQEEHFWNMVNVAWLHFSIS